MIGDVASAIAVVCVAFMAWDLGRKYLGDRKLEYGKDVAILTRRCDALDYAWKTIGQTVDSNLEHLAAHDRKHDTWRELHGGTDKALNRIDKEHDELRDRVKLLAAAVSDLSKLPTEPPDITKLVERDAWLESAIKNMGIEARSELALRVTKSQLEDELKQIRSVQAAMLAMGGRNRR